jgi:oligoribonuclease
MDLEMTGLDPTRHVIVEVASLVTDDQLTIVEEGPDLVVSAPPGALAAMEEPVRDMHERSGLRAEVEASPLSLEEAETRTLDFIRAHVPQPGTAPLCGNSIGTDRKFLAVYMPAIEHHLHYRSIDVSTVKELCRRWYPDAFAAAPEKASGHRALQDIRESVAELAYYRSAIFRPA